MIITSIIVLICLFIVPFATNKYWQLAFFVLASAFFAAWCRLEENTIGIIVYSVIGLLGVICLLGSEDDLNKKKPKRKKSKFLAIVLSILGGTFGLHKFYLRKYAAGGIYLLFFWTTIPLFLGIIDGILLFFTSKTKFEANYNTSSLHNNNVSASKTSNIHTTDNSPTDHKTQEQFHTSPQVNSDIENISCSNVPIGRSLCSINGNIEDFDITLRDSEGNLFRFRCKDGNICSYMNANKSSTYKNY